MVALIFFIRNRMIRKTISTFCSKTHRCLSSPGPLSLLLREKVAMAIWLISGGLREMGARLIPALAAGSPFLNVSLSFVRICVLLKKARRGSSLKMK